MLMNDDEWWRWMMTNERRWGMWTMTNERRLRMSWLVLMNEDGWWWRMNGDEWQVMCDVWHLFHTDLRFACWCHEMYLLCRFSLRNIVVAIAISDASPADVRDRWLQSKRKPLHTEAVTRKSVHTQELSQVRGDTKMFTQKSCYPKTPLHTGAFTQNSVYTQEL